MGQMILEWFAEGKSREEVVELVMVNQRVPEIEARFRIAIELGERDGDIVELDKAAPVVRQSSRAAESVMA